MSAGALVDMATHFEISRFLVHEAWLLDDRQYEAWVALFSEDLRYWAPARRVRMVSNLPGDRAIEHEFTGEGELHIFDETKQALALRIARVSTARQLWAENPPGRNRHLITNIEAWHGATPDEFTVKSNFAVFHARFDHEGNQFFGTREDVLRQHGGSFQIAARKITLDSTVIWTGALTTFF